MTLDLYLVIRPCLVGMSQNEECRTGSLPQGSVSRFCFVVCFGCVSHRSPQVARLKMRGLFRDLFRRSVSGYVSGSVSSKSNFPALLEVGHPKKKEIH